MTLTNEHGIEAAPRPVTQQERDADRWHRFPPPYTLAGQVPDTQKGTDAQRILEICAHRKGMATLQPGLVLQVETPYLRWYIVFNEPDATHERQWFKEASGGQNEYFGTDEFPAFLARIDEPIAVQFQNHGIVRTRNT